MTTIFGNPGSTELPDARRVSRRLQLRTWSPGGRRGRDGRRLRTGERTRDAREPAHGARPRQRRRRAVQPRAQTRLRCSLPPASRTRALTTMQANLTNREAIEVPKPFVKWGSEPTRAGPTSPTRSAQADPSREGLPPRRARVRTIRMDENLSSDAKELASVDFERQIGARSPDAPSPTRAELRRSPRAPPRGRSARCSWARPGHRRGWRLGRRRGARRAPAAARVGLSGDRREPARFPEDHPAFQGVLPPAVGPDRGGPRRPRLVLVAGSSVFPYYPNIPGDLLAEETELVAITSDPDEAARAPMGDAMVADVALTLRALADVLGDAAGREAPPVREAAPAPEEGEPLAPGAVYATLRKPVSRRWHRRARVAVEHAGAAQPAAPLGAPAPTTTSARAADSGSD